MARKKDKSQVNKNSSEISMIDRAVQNIFQILDPTYAGREAISAKDSHVRSILNRELEISNGVSGGSVVDFIASLQDKTMVNASHRNATQKEDIFTQNINEIFGYFENKTSAFDSARIKKFDVDIRNQEIQVVQHFGCEDKAEDKSAQHA